jgi:membrane associated rhomboid family serine protease
VIPLSDGIPARRFPFVGRSVGSRRCSCTPAGATSSATCCFWAIFGKNVEDAFGRARHLSFYVVGGFVAAMTQALFTLIGGSAADATVPTLGASGAIAAVLGAYFVLYPHSRVLTLVIAVPIRISAWVFLGLWFLYQLVEANFGLFSAHANAGGTAFFAQVGGFVFGLIVARWLASIASDPGRAGEGELAGAGATP